MILLTASNKSSGSAAVPAARRDAAPPAGGSNPGPTVYRQEDDPFLDGVLLDLIAESAINDPARPQPVQEAPRPTAPIAPDLAAGEPLQTEASERRRRRIPVLGISLFALFVAGGAAYSSLRMPIGSGTEAAVSSATEPAAVAGGVVTAGLAISEADKDQDRLRETEWPAPPPLAPIPGAVSTAAPVSTASLPPAPQPTPAPTTAFTGSIPPPAAGAATSAVARTAVNMRSGPDRGSPVVSVVAAGTPVEVRSCDFWCDVVVGGQAGWIYQDYLEGPIDRRVQ